VTPRWGQRGEEPPVPDELPSRPLDVFAAMATHDVDYVAIGGIAMQGHGHLRATYDVDLVLAPDKENLKRAAAALAELRARIGGVDGDLLGIDPQDPRALEEGANFMLATTAGPLDLWVDTTYLGGARAWPQLRAAAETTTVGDIPVTIASTDDLISMKRVAAENRDSAERRNQDLGDIAALTRADNPGAGEIVDRESRGSVEEGPADLGPDYGISPDR
jgi:hypothetical protein